MVKFGFVSFLLGSIALPAVAFDDLEEMPESWCLTYLSTYLVTISAAASSPTKGQFPSIETSASSDASIVFNPSSSIFPEETSFATSMTTIAIESAPPSSTTNPSTESEPIVLRIVRKAPDNNRMQRRDVGGFIGTPSGICDNAEEFRLVGAQLVAGNAPIYFNGEDYKVFGAGNGEVPSGAVTRTFFRDGGILRFQNSRIVPNGEAGFCQTPSDGQVYITFSSQPAGCIPVNLAVIGVQDCQDGVETSSVIATNSEAEQIPSVSSSGPIISASSSSESVTPEITTRPAAAVTTQPNGVVTTHNPIIVSNPSSTFQWSNISASFEPPPRTSKSSLIHFSPSIFTSGSSTSIEADSTTEVIEPQLSTTEGLTSTDALPASEIGTSTEETSTADLEPTTETASIETTTTDLTTEVTTTQESSTQETIKDTTTAETIVTTTEGLTENPTSTILTSVLDSTTETTTEAATTTTTESSVQIVCPSNPQQCISTFQIQCDTVIGGIPLSSSPSTLDECSQACFKDPSCVIFTHSGSQCFSTSDPSNNAGSFPIQGWISGIRGSC
ncbi:hypothetical protein FCULG_00001460 [Fusarium culmorum]|uniref:DUF7908 domain-containing protein n=1 Tax=Fusarium culmorum TaxID=5516 RepID=A0A2T4GLB5_FUSCU|nr:hypothetical protein FCULG_00001460 [Fusarium culmorum]